MTFSTFKYKFCFNNILLSTSLYGRVLESWEQFHEVVVGVQHLMDENSIMEPDTENSSSSRVFQQMKPLRTIYK